MAHKECHGFLPCLQRRRSAGGTTDPRVLRRCPETWCTPTLSVMVATGQWWGPATSAASVLTTTYALSARGRACTGSTASLPSPAPSGALLR